MPQEVQKYPPPSENLRESFLTPWLGRKRHAHDDQWEAFRTNIPIIVIFMFGWRFIVQLVAPKNKIQALLRSPWLGFTLMCYCFRADLILYLSLILGWFFMTNMLIGTKVLIPLSWIIVIVVLYLNEQLDHFRFLSNWLHDHLP